MADQKRRWLEERKRDFYHKKAIQMGYRSRAVFKLKQIDHKYGILKNGDTVLDIGCSPGGWSQYSVEKVGQNGKVFGVDIEHMKPLSLRGFNFVPLDIMEPRSIEKLKHVIDGPVNVVLSDLAPNMCGTYEVDVLRQVALAQKAFQIAINLLTLGGRLVLKVFEGPDSRSIEEEARHYFTRVSRFRPAASRKRSSEFYLVCLGFKIPRRNQPSQVS